MNLSGFLGMHVCRSNSRYACPPQILKHWRPLRFKCPGTALHSVAYPTPRTDPTEALTETSREQTITRIVSEKILSRALRQYKSKKSNSRLIRCIGSLHGFKSFHWAAPSLVPCSSIAASSL